jgi:RimJ/RimL family protein N-acetyltransferase/acyl carrier protein
MIKNKSDFYKILDKEIPQIIPVGNEKDRIFFQRISADHLEKMHEYSKDQGLYEFLDNNKPHETLKETKNYLDRLLFEEGKDVDGKKRMNWFVTREADNKIIGSASLLNIDYKKQMTEWGFGLSSEYWGRSYGICMLESLRKYIFERLLLNRVYGCTRIDNLSVINLMIALGAKNEGTARQCYRNLDNEYFDGWIFSILKSDIKLIPVNDIKDHRELNLNGLIKIISTVLKCDNINEDSNINNVENWNSLTHLELIVAIEKGTEYKFSPDDIVKCLSVKKIYQVIN